MAEYTSDNFRESRRRAMEVMGHLFQEMDEVVSSIFSRDGSTVNHDALKRLEALGRSLSPDRITTN
jgi:HEAT repeat protein